MNRIDEIDELAKNGISVIDNFIKQDECNKILFRINNNAWKRSTIAFLDENNTIRSNKSGIRTSNTLFECDFCDSLTSIVLKVQDRLSNKFSIDPARLESWQITKYSYRQGFGPHLDGGLWRQQPGGERENTLLIYLMSPLDGGNTYFRALNLSLRPTQGRLVIWNNLLPNGKCNHAMIHSGEPVTKGMKIILHTWLRQFPTNINRRNHEIESYQSPGSSSKKPRKSN